MTKLDIRSQSQRAKSKSTKRSCQNSMTKRSHPEEEATEVDVEPVVSVEVEVATIKIISMITAIIISMITTITIIKVATTIITITTTKDMTIATTVDTTRRATITAVTKKMDIRTKAKVKRKIHGDTLKVMTNIKRIKRNWMLRKQ